MAGLLMTEGPTTGANTLVALTGELDIKTAPDLCSHLSRHRGKRVVVDLTNVAFCDSCGLRALMGEAREARFAGGSLAIVAPDGGQVRRLLDLTGLTTVLPTFASTAAATA